MKHLSRGQFYGHTNETIHLDGITLTDTEYTHDRVDWHYHENAYFTFILQGHVLEGDKKEVHTCSPGTVLFHNWQEPHYNVKPPGFTRGFHIELEQKWINQFCVGMENLQGSMHVSDPALKLLLYNIFKETKINDDTSSLSVQALLLQLLSGLQQAHQSPVKTKPRWVQQVTGLLHDECCEKFTLSGLSATLGIHPVHLSRDFPKYFHCGLGEYIRKLRIERSLSLLPDTTRSLTDISFGCGFADQSHFNRSFKEVTGISPLAYRRLFFVK